jgi:peptide deformylase
MDFSLDDALTRVRTYGDTVLQVRCRELDDFSKAAGVAAKLVDGLEREPNGIGLAANQIGLSVRAFSYDLRGTDDERSDFHGVCFNPVIVETSGGSFYNEGCLSIPGLRWDIYRPEEIHVVGFDADGNDVEFELDGLAARLFQHEIDHLDGKLILDRITDKGEHMSAIIEAERLLRDLELQRRVGMRFL